MPKPRSADKTKHATIRHKTDRPGVYYLIGKVPGTNKTERIYYITYRHPKTGKVIEEKAGRAGKDGMTEARAATARALRIAGKEPSNSERRAVAKAAEEARKAKEAEEQNKWTLDRLWKEYKKGRQNTASLRIDNGRYTNHLKKSFGDKEPQDIVQLDVDRVRIRLGKKKAPQSVKHILNLLDRIINFGVRKQLCQPLGFKIEKPRVDNEKTEDLSEEQLKKLLEVVQDSEDIQAANLVRMALFTGMRRGELFKLKWQDVNFEKGFISIRDPKSGTSQTIPLNSAARDVLDHHSRLEGSPYVFPGRGGKQRVDAQRGLSDIKRKAKLPKDFRILHGLRHVYASTLASSGQVDMYVLQRLLTHKSPKMTQRYAHLRDQALKRAADLAGDIFQEIGSKKKLTVAEKD